MALTLELREKDAINKSGNGDWESVLQDKIVLNDGDSVVMKSCFVDTEATSNQKIVIEKPITLNLEWIYFLNANIAYNTTAKPDNVINPFVAGLPAFSPTYKQYYMTHPKATGGAGGYASLNQIQFLVNVDAKAFPSSGLIPAFDGTLSYLDLNSVRQTIRYSVKQFQYVPIYADNQNVSLGQSISLLLTGGDPQNVGITYENPTYEELSNRFFYFPEAQTQEGDGDFTFSPEIASTSIELPAGSYSPVQLCNFLNTELTKSTIEGTSLYGNNFLQQTNNDGTDSAGYATQVFLENSEDQVSGIRAKDPYSFLYGANQIEFTYLDSQQLFAIDQIHTSMYDSAGNKVVTYLPSETEVLSSYSQIAFTHLGAVEKETGNTYNFWADKLGFDLDSVLIKSTLRAKSNQNYMANTNVDFTTFEFNTENGINTTADLASIDGLVSKTSNFFEPIQEENATSDVNTRIPALSSVFGKTDQFGYFLIEVRANMGGKFITADANEASIRAVVSRFYEQNSYVTGTESDAVIYTHRGQPAFLDSFKCRVLDSGRKLAENIGSDNTIFLSIIRKE